MNKLIDDYRSEHFTKEEWLFYGLISLIMTVAALLIPAI